jgi:cyclopropane-fatty-acyl-phospholipid synthase
MLALLLRSVVQAGTLVLLRQGKPPQTFGNGAAPRVTIRLADRAAEWRLATNPDLALGELYMEGRLTIEEGDIAGLLDLLIRNLGAGSDSALRRMTGCFRRITRALSQFNPASRAKAHVAHHYDLSARLYDLFLGADKQYSCAYFRNPEASIEEAQYAKKRHIIAKLHIDRPDLSVLDIGCGWGGMGLQLARDTGAKVTGITLSEEQLVVAKDRAERSGLGDRCDFRLEDYRAVQGRFDRIVSVGMFEHVGVPYYDAYFRTVNRLLDERGVMLLHTIGRTGPPGATNPWIAKYIFPGGYVPALSEVTPVIERNGLIVTDVEVLRLHYAETLKLWRARFEANRAEIAALYDEKFCRMWEFYLAGSEATFRHDGEVVFQIQICKRLDALPITRDYMVEDERRDSFVVPAPRIGRAA